MLAVGQLPRRTPDLLGSEAREDGRQDPRLERPPHEALLVEHRIDAGREARVHLGQLAPVRARVLVVRRVEAVVEHHEVEQLAHEVPRVVRLRPRVRVHVLHVVERHDHPQRVDGRQREGEEEDLGADEHAVHHARSGQERDVRARPDDVLRDDLAEEGAVRLTRLADVRLDRIALVVARHEEVRRGDEQVVSARVAPRDRRVAGPVHQLVVVQVVRRDPRERRVAVEDRQPQRHHRVEPLVAERRRVQMVVREDAGARRQVAPRDREPRRPGRVKVRDHREGGHHGHPQDGAIIGGVARQHRAHPRTERGTRIQVNCCENTCAVQLLRVRTDVASPRS